MQKAKVYIIATFTEGEKGKNRSRILMAAGLLDA
jgi:hypothetical protein